MKKVWIDPQDWAWAIVILLLGLAVAYNCSGIGKERDVIIDGCDRAVPHAIDAETQKESYEALIRCIEVRTQNLQSNEE